MLSGASVAVTTRSNFEVERTINFVFFGAVYFRESFCHVTLNFNYYTRYSTH